MISRRHLLWAGATASAWPAARATPAAMQAAVAVFAGGAPVREGRVQLEISPLVENGNAVPVAVWVDGPEAAAVRRLAIFTEGNPQPEVAVFEFGPLAGAAHVATRLRLATSQTVVALAQMADGNVWQRRVDVLVTLAACVEGG